MEKICSVHWLGQFSSKFFDLGVLHEIFHEYTKLEGSTVMSMIVESE